MSVAQEMKNLTEEIEVSYGERMSWLSDLEEDTHQMMDHIRKDRQALAKALGAFLDDSESTRIANFKETLSDIRSVLSGIQADRREREKRVASLIKRFEDELQEMATELKAFLGESESKRLEEFKKMLAAIQSQQRGREEEVSRLLTAVQKDMGEARTHWQNLAKILASKRTSKGVPISKVPEEAEVPKKVEKAAEEAFKEGELKVKVLALVGESPEGITLRKLGERLGVSYVRLAKPIKELMGEGKVVKRDSLYFPASAEA